MSEHPDDRRDRFMSGPGLIITKKDGRVITLPMKPGGKVTIRMAPEADERLERFGSTSAKGISLLTKEEAAKRLRPSDPRK